MNPEALSINLYPLLNEILDEEKNKDKKKLNTA
jgi:hypothetical protein